eukprot:1191530-Prorocentrum_minimum.AAC.7
MYICPHPDKYDTSCLFYLNLAKLLHYVKVVIFSADKNVAVDCRYTRCALNNGRLWAHVEQVWAHNSYDEAREGKHKRPRWAN